MADIELVQTAAGLRGLGQDNDRAYKRYKAFLKKLKAGEFFVFSYKRQRNSQHHRKFFALVNYVAENSDTYNTKDKALTAIKVAAGHCDFVPNPRGDGLLAVPRPINFADMDQTAFDEFYANAIQGVLDHIIPHMNRVALQQALDVVSRY